MDSQRPRNRIRGNPSDRRIAVVPPHAAVTRCNDVRTRCVNPAFPVREFGCPKIEVRTMPGCVALTPLCNLRRRGLLAGRDSRCAQTLDRNECSGECHLNEHQGAGHDGARREVESSDAVGDADQVGRHRRRGDPARPGDADRGVTSRAAALAADLRCCRRRRELRPGLGRRSRADRRLGWSGGRRAGADRRAARVRGRSVLRLRLRPQSGLRAVRGGQHDGFQPATDGSGVAGRGAHRPRRGH
jgi:hypothetical protein